MVIAGLLDLGRLRVVLSYLLSLVMVFGGTWKTVITIEHGSPVCSQTMALFLSTSLFFGRSCYCVVTFYKFIAIT